MGRKVSNKYLGGHESLMPHWSKYDYQTKMLVCTK